MAVTLTNKHMQELRARMFDPVTSAGQVEDTHGMRVKINDGPNFYMLYKDIFCRRIYHFEAETRAPRILDCGSNIGMSILYFKTAYPQARITAFEPDPMVIPYLTHNINANNLTDIEVVRAALSPHRTTATFVADGKYASAIQAYAVTAEQGAETTDVECVQLGQFLDEPVDFLKMNIEGAESDVLTASESELRAVREMVIEYHHLPGQPRTLDKILSLLSRQGFDYLVNDFDSETNPQCQPPFRLDNETHYFLLIYAKRRDQFS